jgi:hypothetical protein
MGRTLIILELKRCVPLGKPDGQSCPVPAIACPRKNMGLANFLRASRRVRPNLNSRGCRIRRAAKLSRAVRMRRMQEDVEMTSVVDMIKAEGKAEGAALAILSLVAKGRLTVAEARLDLQDLKAQGLLDAAAYQDALQKLEELH